MNVLFLYEYRKQSANYIIALKLINEFKKNGNNVFDFYFYNEKTVGGDDANGDLWDFSVNSPLSYPFYINKYTEFWNKRSRGNKLKYFISHPKYACSYLSYKIDLFTNYAGGRKKIKKFCVEHEINCIIGLSAPHEIEKIVSDIKLKVPVIVIRFDPYAYNPCYLESEFNKRLAEEYKILSSIDKLFTTDLIIKDLLTHNEIKNYVNKMHAIEIPNLSDNDGINNHAEAKRHLFNKDSRYTYLLHAGTFYDGIRTPDKLVDFIKALPEEYYLIVAGTNSSEIRKYDKGVSNRIIDLGSLSREDVLSVIDDCDFLISYNNLNTNMVPSKLFECIDSLKPFINLCHTSQCPTIKYVKDYDMAFTVIADQPLPREELIQFLKQKKGCTCSRELIHSRFEKCTIEYVAKLIMDEI